MSDALERLERDGLLRRVGSAYRTTRRWQSAMTRAAFRLLRSGEESEDLRVPIAVALVSVYGTEIEDAELAAWVEAVLPIEARELDPSEHIARARSG